MQKIIAKEMALSMSIAGNPNQKIDTKRRLQP